MFNIWLQQDLWESIAQKSSITNIKIIRLQKNLNNIKLEIVLNDIKVSQKRNDLIKLQLKLQLQAIKGQ